MFVVNLIILDINQVCLVSEKTDSKYGLNFILLWSMNKLEEIYYEA